VRLHTSEKNSCISSFTTATTAAASLAVASASFTLAPGIILRRFKGLRHSSDPACCPSGAERLPPRVESGDHRVARHGWVRAVELAMNSLRAQVIVARATF
jgi:hypothetical protein